MGDAAAAMSGAPRTSRAEALVTGGGGFLGSAIIRMLVADQRFDSVRSLCRGDYPELAAIGVEARRGDIADAGTVSAAVAGCDVVFHVAAKAGVWGPYREYYRSNVTGTENVIAACREHGVPRLIYTSSPSVIHGGGDVAGGDESLPYPERYTAHYPRTKAMAEQLVLAANDANLATVALRPHLIWGPGDNHLVPRIVKRGRAGALRLVGGGVKLADSVYIDNAAAAHLLACDRLGPDSACAGRAYFISQDEPLAIGDLINRILAAAGVEPVTRSISPRLAWIAGCLLEAVWGLARLRGEPPMTRFLADQLATAHWYDISAARRDLGYDPEISIDEGFQRLREWFSLNRAASAKRM